MCVGTVGTVFRRKFLGGPVLYCVECNKINLVGEGVVCWGYWQDAMVWYVVVLDKINLVGEDVVCCGSRQDAWVCCVVVLDKINWF